MGGNWTREQVERVVRTAFHVEKRDSVSLDVEHADYHNIAQIIRWANENGWHAVEIPECETVRVTKKPPEAKN